MKQLGLISLLFFIVQVQAFAKCNQMNIRKAGSNKHPIKPETLCKTSTSKNAFVSQDCKDLECPILKNPKGVIVEDSSSQFGNPSFRLCEKLNGLPEKYEIQKKTGSFSERDRCLWGSTFVDMEILLKVYKNHVVWND